MAREISCEPYNKGTFDASLKKIRALTTKSPEAFVPEMQKMCAESGFALVLVPRMKKVPWHGATKWLKPNKAMILLSLRGKGEDKFWFSFFHEAGHVLHDNKKKLYINDGNEEDPVEKRADEYASNILIPSKYRAKIPELTSNTKIIAFARQLGICPGIVAGQYQFITQNWSYFHDLIRKFEWTKE